MDDIPGQNGQNKKRGLTRHVGGRKKQDRLPFFSEWRKRWFTTQRSLAEALGLANHESVSKWERQERGPDVELVLSKLTGEALDDFKAMLKARAESPPGKEKAPNQLDACQQPESTKPCALSSTEQRRCLLLELTKELNDPLGSRLSNLYAFREKVLQAYWYVDAELKKLYLSELPHAEVNLSGKGLTGRRLGEFLDVPDEIKLERRKRFDLAKSKERSIKAEIALFHKLGKRCDVVVSERERLIGIDSTRPEFDGLYSGVDSNG